MLTHIKKKNQDYLVEIISDDDFNNYSNSLSLVISDGEKEASQVIDNKKNDS